MYFQHSQGIWSNFPDLVPGVVIADGLTRDASVGSRIAHFNAIAESRLASSTEGEFPEIHAWRRAFSKMGLKPTQYRCASESLLRRFRKEGSLPEIHPLIDLCNAVSMAFAIPVAVFDVSRIAEYIEVRQATGHETYETFSGETEHPDANEVIFADAAGQAHARRWCNRQSGYSPTRATTSKVLIVAEAMHGAAAEDVQKLVSMISTELNAVWSIAPDTAILNQSSPRFEF